MLWLKRSAIAILGATLLSLSPVARATNILDPIVTFEGRARDAAVRVSNNGGARPVTYRVDLVDLRKDAKGQMVEGTVDRSAVAFLRFSPRQFTLAPGETQAIRLSLRKPADLAPGEYRSYLRVTELPSDEQTTGPLHIEFLVRHQLPIIVKN